MGRLAALAAAAIALYLAYGYAACMTPTCVASRFEIAFLAVAALAALAVAVSLVVWHRFTPMLLALVVPCFAGLYLFEAVAVGAQERYIVEVLDQLRSLHARGIRAVPQWVPAGFAAGKGVLKLSDGDQVVPLTGPSDRLVLVCQEGARPIMTYQADEFGLNNPAEAWRAPTEILFLGDSFTHGACVDDAAHFVAAVRQHHPRTINLGYSGNGPLIELAGLREYGRHLRPRYVFWMYDEANDVLTYSPPSDLDAETEHPILASYLARPDFTQRLFVRQKMVNAGINAFADAWAASARPMTIRQHLVLRATREVLREAYVRMRVTMPFVLSRDGPVPEARLEQFRAIMQAATNEVAKWDGRLVFVNLPALLQACLGRDHPSRTAIIDIPRRLGIDLIDLEGPLFDLARDKGARVIAAVPPCAGHYSEAGYAVIAKVLLEYLEIAPGGPLPPSWSEHGRPDGGRQLIYVGHAHDRAKPLTP